MPPTRNSEYQLFVEGVDDAHSVRHLLMRHGYDWDDARIVRPYVHELGNDREILEALPLALKASHYHRLGILMDTDTSLSSRWAQLRGRAQEAGLALGAQAQEEDRQYRRTPIG